MDRPPLTAEERTVMDALLAGHIVGGRKVCPKCGARPCRTESQSCRYCVDGKTHSKPGRKEAFTDAELLDAIRTGADKADLLMRKLKVKSKSNLMRRVRALRDAGYLTIEEYPWGRMVRNGRIELTGKEMAENG